jgi:DNA polymerase-3 subunit delta
MVEEPSVYLLAGSEQFLKEDTLARLKSTFLDKKSWQFNFNVFYGASASAREILECAATSPFLGRKRVVLVRQFTDLSASDKGLILSYVKAPHRQALLILETSQGNLYQNSLAEICRHARVIFCKPLEGKPLFAWIEARVGSKGKRIEQKALAILVDNLGNDLQLLSATLDNLILFIGEKTTVGASDAEKLVGPDLSTSAFELFDAVSVRKKERAFGILDSLFKDGIKPSQILGALAYKIISERNKLRSPRFERILQELQSADSDIKTGRQNQRIALELLLARLLDLL